jgi:uncharacterized protein (TIGR03067 family)
MKMSLLLVACALFLFAETLCANESNDKDDQGDMAKIQGVWIVVSGEKGGRKAPEDGLKGGKLTFAGSKFIWGLGAKETEATFTLNATKTTNEIDLKAEDGMNLLGIYRLDGDDLNICVSAEGNRPTEFATREGEKSALLILKRGKP